MKIDAINRKAESNYELLRKLGLDRRFNAKSLHASAHATHSAGSKGTKGATEANETEETQGTEEANGTQGNLDPELSDRLKKLGVGRYKFRFLRMMRRDGLLSLIGFLSKEQMVNAMRLFPKIMLVRFLGMLPKEMLLKMMLWQIPLKKFLMLFKTKVLFSMFHSKRLNIREMVNGLQHLPESILQKLMSDITGRDMSEFKKEDLLAMFRQLDKLVLLNGMRKMSYKHILEFAFQTVNKDPMLLMNIPQGELTKLLSKMPKPMLVEMFNLLPESMLMEFLNKLSDKALWLALYQLDDNLFEYLMLNQFGQLIKDLDGAA